MNMVVIVTLVVFFIVKFIRKREDGFDLAYLCSLNEDYAMGTYNILENYRNVIGNHQLWLDIFETDATYTIMTNIGILTEQGEVMIPYSEIKDISVAKKTASPVGNKALWEEVVVTMKDERQCPVKYQVTKDNCFGALFSNIVKKGYPIPEYQGNRE